MLSFIRGPLTIVLISAAAVAPGGCRSLPATNLLSRSSGEQPDKTGQDAASSEPNAFKRAGETAEPPAPDDTKGEKTEAAENGPAGKASAGDSSAGKAYVSHDAETLKQIEQELKHVAPSERQRILNQLKSARPDAVQYYLQLLRNQRQLGNLKGSGAEQPDLSGDEWSQRLTTSTNTIAANGTAGRADGEGARRHGRAQDGRGDGPVGYSTIAAGSRRDEHPQPRGPSMPGAHSENPDQWRALPAPGDERRSNFDRDASAGPGRHAERFDGNPADRRAGNGDGGSPSRRSRFLDGMFSSQGDERDHASTGAPRDDSNTSRFSLQRLGFGNDGGRARDATGDAAGEPNDELPSQRNDDADDWDRSLRRLIALADARAQTTVPPSPKDELEHIQNHVYLRMLYLMSGQQQQAMDAIPDISPAEQEFWQHTLWGLADYFRSEGIADKGNRATQTLTQFRTAIARLREHADLEIGNLVFCRKITNFGNYEVVPRNEFRAGEQVLIYAEIDNFKTELTENGRYTTRLKSTLEIYPDVDSGGGRAVERFEFAPTEDVSRRRRRDYFHSYVINLPTDLPLGDYKLKLTVEDQLGGKMATDIVRFRIN